MKLFHAPRSLLKRNASQISSKTKIFLICHRLLATRITTHYDTLHLKKDCTSDDIRKSFTKLSKMYHPDTSKMGSAEQNTRKFQEIMEAYRVLSKKSSRDAYDMEISYQNYQNPHYATPFQQRDRRYNDAQSAYWQHMYNMRNNTTGYYRTNGYYNSNENENWNPANFLNKRTIYSFLLIFISLNFFVVYSTYMITKRNQMLGYSSRGQRILYEMPRHGAHGIHAQQFQRSAPKDE